METDDAALKINVGSIENRNDILSDAGMKYQYADSKVRFGIFSNSDICKRTKLSLDGIKHEFSSSQLDESDHITDILLPCKEFEEHACISAWNDIILTQDVTIINNSEHDIEIERNLLGYLTQRLNSLTQRLNSLLGININRKTLKEENLRKEFTEKFEIYFNNYNYRYYVSLPQELDSLLIEFWKIGVLPIILKSEEGNNFEKYIHSGRKYILITNSSNFKIRRTTSTQEENIS
ncbi:hypothetical protein QE152_g5133 [Popillia japonica]|uniref:Uncharacterized protein n=1 Tax=Popillia japonica TaxID=7064 RepID=A0AAW1MXS9_POPJA